MNTFEYLKRTFCRLICIATALSLVSCAQQQGDSQISTIASSIFSAAGVNVSSSQVDSMFTAGSKLSKAARGFTEEQEYYLGRGVSAVVLSKYAPLNNQKITRYSNLVARTLSSHSERPETFGGYHVLVLNSGEINAVSAPGGFIFVTKGIISTMPSEDALAAVLAHEIGHVVKGHGINAISEANITSALTTIGKEVAQSQGDFVTQQLTSAFGDSISQMTETLLEKGYSRSQEYEADEFAAELLKKAGYNPRALITMLQAIEKHSKGGSDSSGWLSTHPTPEKRISNLGEDLEAANINQTAEKARADRFIAAARGL